MSQRRAKVKAAAKPMRLRMRVRCTECDDAVVVELTGEDLSGAFWRAGRWLLSVAGMPGSSRMVDGVLQPLCPPCQDKHCDPETIKVARDQFSKRYDLGLN